MIKDNYDLIVVGGGTSGVSCAWNAAVLGLKVLLIEKTSCLGGAITNMLVVPAMQISKNSINNDFYNKLYNELYEINGAITYSDGNKGWFNPELTKIIMDKMLIENGVDILFESEVVNIRHNNRNILSVDIDTIYDDKNSLFFNNTLLVNIETKYLVDATGNGKICEDLNCEIIKNSNKDYQPTSLRFILSGINLEKFEKWLIEFDKDRTVTTSYKLGDAIHLSTAYTWDTGKEWALKPLFKDAVGNSVLEVEDTNYFQIFTIPGMHNSIAFNAPRIVKSKLTRTEQYIYARSAILRLANFCKIYLPGFEKSYISNIANTLGVRVTKRYKGKYIYTYQDLIEGRKFENPVIIADYPVDIHSENKDKSKLEKVRKEYQLPIEALMVKDFENLFVIGKCISAEFEAQAALRIIPSCFSMGEGLAKYIKHLQSC